MVHGGAQVAGDQLHGLERAGVGDGRGGGGHIGLHRVGQRVHAGGSRQALGLGQHQLGVVDGQDGRDVAVHDGHLDVARFVGDDAKARHLAGGARRGVDGHQGQLRLGRAVHALVVGNLAAVGGAQGNALGAVVRRAAAQRDHEVALLGLQLRQPGAHIAHGGVGLGAIKHHRGNLLPGQLGLDARRHAELAEHGVGNDQRLAKAVTLQGHHGFLQAACAHDVDTGHEERTGHREPPW